MLKQYPRLQLLFWPVLVFFLAFVLMRAGFYWWFLEDALRQPLSVQLEAWLIGVRFDLRLALILVLPLVVISWLPGFIGLRGRLGRALALAWVVLSSLYVVFTYIVDFAHYAYLDERVNVSVLRFLEDGTDSFQMVWESYPVITLFAVLFAVSYLFYRTASSAIHRFCHSEATGVSWAGWATGGMSAVLVVFGLMGKVGTTIPLRWSDAYFANDMQVASLALNPVLFFFDTLSHQTREYDEDLLRAHYDQVARYLSVDEPSRENLNFVRQREGREWNGQRPNVVFIHLESMGANRMGVFGNATGATPNLDRIAREGALFSNFMVPSSGTARTVFGLITGIPDVSWGGTTASRNPLIVDQYTLVNAFEGYNRLYFIGGSAGWANIKGVLETNIDDLELWEEGDWQAPNVDVWGISDFSLFVESHQRLTKLPDDEPFVAFIQTAGNHRPFTIPDEDNGFEIDPADEAEVQKYGFLGVDQYNAVRLLDHNIGYYLDKLVAGSWYEGNTIFVFYGDHNDRSLRSVHMGYSDRLYLDKHHVPLIIYAPGLVAPERIEEPASLVDVMPTVLGIAGLPYENRTMGRDLFREHEHRYALTFGGDRTNHPLLGLLGHGYHFYMHHDASDPRLYPLDEELYFKDNRAEQYPDVVADRTDRLMGLYQAARYMMHHNRNEAHAGRAAGTGE